MTRVILKVKRLNNNPDLPLPSYQSDGSSGLDLRAAVNKDLTLQPGNIELIPIGLSISLPEGYEAQIRPRSGLALRDGLGFVNKPLTIKRGERIAQMVISKVSKATVEEVSELDGTKRGEGGFGHSGT